MPELNSEKFCERSASVDWWCKNGGQDTDKYTQKRLGVLKAYLKRYGLKVDIVCNDDSTEELCFCTEKYSEDIRSEDWKLLADVIK